MLLKGATPVPARLLADGVPHPEPAGRATPLEVRARAAHVALITSRHPRSPQDALRSAAGTAYAWLSSDVEALAKRSALAGAFDLGSRAREEALSAALRTIVQASRLLCARSRRRLRSACRCAPRCACWT